MRRGEPIRATVVVHGLMWFDTDCFHRSWVLLNWHWWIRSWPQVLWDMNGSLLICSKEGWASLASVAWQERWMYRRWAHGDHLQQQTAGEPLKRASGTQCRQCVMMQNDCAAPVPAWWSPFCPGTSWQPPHLLTWKQHIPSLQSLVMFKNQSCLYHSFRALKIRRNKQIESYTKASASGNQALLQPLLWQLPKTVERSLVDSKNTASEANEWEDDLNQPYDLASFREFRNNSDDAQWLYTINLLHVSKGNSSICYLVQVENQRRFDCLSSPETIFPKSAMKATGHQKDDPLQMKYPTAKCPTLHYTFVR